MGHIYEEIPPTPPPTDPRDDVGRVYYVSPLDGALCRIFPVDGRAVHRSQLACAHVPSAGDDRPSPIDVEAAAAGGLRVVRGRELRLCAACYRQVRAGLAGVCRQRGSDGAASPSPSSLSSSFYNSCDLGQLNIPCYYSSEAGGDVVDTEDVAAVTAEPQRSDADDALPVRPDRPARDLTSGDVINVVAADATDSDTPTRTPKFGEAGVSAFTRFDRGGGRRAGWREEGPTRNGEEDDRRRPRPCRVVTDPSFDVRRRPLRDADDAALLAVLDSAPEFRFRSRRDDVDGLPVRRVGGGESTSCADVRWARRRSLVGLRRRSDDNARRRRVPATATPGGEAAATCRSGSESSLHSRRGVKSVYYNGLLASMIDLTAAFDRAAADDDDDRLSCRATSGPRRSLRSSRQSPSSSSTSSSGVCRRDGFASSVRHSSGDLRLGSVQ